MAAGGNHPNSEKVISPWWGIGILLAAFLFQYQPWLLGSKDFFRQEGLFAAVTQELSLQLPTCTAHGTVMLSIFPLFPAIGKVLTGITGMDTVFTLRLISVFMTFAAGVLILFSVWRARNFTAAAMALAMFWGSNIVIEKSLDAVPTSTMTFSLLSAQLCWLYVGQKRGAWSLAWFLSLSILALAFLAGGIQPVLLFFIPMIFLRRPLTLWQKLSKPGMFAGMTVLAGAILAWLIPYQILAPQMPVEHWQPDWRLGKYLEHLWQFPLDFAVRFLPWNLFLWAPFCVALQAQDATPIFSKYLRTILLSTFFILWFSPGIRAEDMLFLAAPLSMMCGMYYEAAVTRYAPRLRGLINHGGSAFVFAASMAVMLFCVLPEQTLLMISDLHLPLTFRKTLLYQCAAITVGCMMLGAAGYIAWGPRQKPLWVKLLIVTLTMCAFYYLVMFPYRIQEQDTRSMARELAITLARDRKPDAGPAVVYKYNISDLYGECSLMDARILKISHLEELPIHTHTVYLLGTEFPQQPDRNWTNLLPEDRTYRDKRICLWKGVLRRDDREAE